MASVIIGVMWAVWHLPLLPMGISLGSGPLPLYMMWVVAATILLTWLYNSTGGSVLLCMFFHAINNASDLFAPQGQVSETVELLASIADISMWWVVALVVLGVYGTDHLASRSGPSPAAAGSSDATGTTKTDSTPAGGESS